MPYEHWINRKKQPDQCKGIPIFTSLQTREREPVFFFLPFSQRLAKLRPFVNTHLQKKNHSLLQKQTVSCEVTYVITRHLRCLVNNIHENNCNLSYIFYFFFPLQKPSILKLWVTYGTVSQGKKQEKTTETFCYLWKIQFAENFLYV